MGKPESVVRKFRFISLPAGFSAGLAMCMAISLSACGSNSDCDVEDSNGDCIAVMATEAATSVASNPEASNSEVSSQSETANLPAASIADINHIVVVTGQSNVEAAETAFDEVLDAPHPRVFAFTDTGWEIADLHQVWDEHAHPGNHSLTVPGRQPNNNFVFHFGKSLAQQDPSAVPAFIVLASPGNGIANWDYESPFYLKMRNKITNALSQIPHRNTIDVMLWHQGESDWQFEGTSDTSIEDGVVVERNYYEIKLRELIANFRSESWAHSELPFICGETRLAFGVNRWLLGLNDDGDPNSACVMATDLPYLLADPTGNHFSAAGLRELGRRYMQQYRAIINRN